VERGAGAGAAGDRRGGLRAECAGPAYRSDAFASGATLGAAALLIAAALYLEYGCRVPTGRDPGAEHGAPPQSEAPR